jgi:purine nucleoside phosphorylase
VNFRANVAALAAGGATAVIGCTACGAVDPALEPGALVVFDDLHFLANRLPDGSNCTFFGAPGDPKRGHWIFGEPFSAELRASLAAGAREAGRPLRDGGCYGHVDGPRFNTRAEIRALAAAGVTAVSQTGGPETVLCGELELPFALVGFVTDFANGVSPGAPTPVAELVRLMGESGEAFAAALSRALPAVAAAPPAPAGVVYRFEPG